MSGSGREVSRVWWYGCGAEGGMRKADCRVSDSGRGVASAVVGGGVLAGRTVAGVVDELVINAYT